MLLLLLAFLRPALVQKLGVASYAIGNSGGCGRQQLALR